MRSAIVFAVELAFFFGHTFLRLTSGNEKTVSHLTTRHVLPRVAIARLKAIAAALSVKIAQACLSLQSDKAVLHNDRERFLFDLLALHSPVGVATWRAYKLCHFSLREPRSRQASVHLRPRRRRLYFRLHHYLESERFHIAG